jgi:adenylate cyclase
MDDEPSIRRRLATILAADIAGYGRLIGQNEAATVRDLKGHQAGIPSVIGASEGAVEIQTVMAARNEDVPEHRRMLFRIGINRLILYSRMGGRR